MRYFAGFALLGIVLIATSAPTLAQPGPTFSAGYELFPHSEISDPDTDAATTFLDTGTIRVGTLTLTGAYPMIWGEGRTVLVNEVSYRRFDLDYDGFPSGADNPQNMQAIQYAATVTHGLSDRWTFMGIAKPGIASDFEGDVGTDDVTFQAVAIFIRAYSERLQIGYGAAWDNSFGQPFPLPILAINWNNGGRLRLSTILPANLEVWYAASQRMEVGMLLNVDGNQYHGDRDIYGVDNPLLQYSVGTIGPALNLGLGEGMMLGLRAGTTFMRRFEFADGSKDVGDYSLKNAGFLNVSLAVAL